MSHFIFYYGVCRDALSTLIRLEPARVEPFFNYFFLRQTPGPYPKILDKAEKAYQDKH